MRSLILRIRRDPGTALFVLALVAATALYLPAIGRGLVNYDDPWLYRDNTLLHHPSWSGVVTVFTDLDSPQRFQLSPEYLPIRDLSVMADYALWGDWYGGFHLTNLVIYLAAIALWFLALTRLGIPKPLAGLALLLWAVHPSHAESVAWLAERKGLLGMMFAGACALGYAAFRAADGKSRVAWLLLAVPCGVFAVWSKAIAAFAVAAILPLELALPERRTSWKRSLSGLVVIGGAALLAYIPVVLLAVRWSIVGTTTAPLPASRAASVVGVHGFYLELASGAIKNAVTYPISSSGPNALQLVLGALGFVAIVVALRPKHAALRAGCVLWLLGWLPVGHLLLPLQMVFVADRYLLVPSLGFALVVAWAIGTIGRPQLRIAVGAVVVLAFALRALDAQASWNTNGLLWQRAIASNPSDGNAWAMYLEALDEQGVPTQAVVDQALAHSRLPRLVLHAALNELAAGHRDAGVALMTEAANRGEPRAMANLANLDADAGRLPEALRWARRAKVAQPSYANGHRIRGKAARLAGERDESRHAFERAYMLEPDSAANRFNLALAYIDSGRVIDAKKLLVSVLDDHVLGSQARAALATLP
ncbi:hypothetical protein BH11MYX1_BH11MYX1_28170 [soil metagenome]